MFCLIPFEFFQQSNVFVGFIFLDISLGFVLEEKFQNMLSFLIFFIHVFSVSWSCHIPLSPTSLSLNHPLTYLLPPSKFHVFFSNLPSLIIDAHIQMCGVSHWVWANHQWLSSPKTRVTLLPAATSYQ